jgi:hypothetical protein
VADTNEQPLTSAECGREPCEDENAADEWRAYRDISDELPVFCPECAEREFGVEGASWRERKTPFGSEKPGN